MPDETVTKRPRLVVEEEVENTPSLPLKSEELPASTTTEAQAEPTPPPPPAVTSFGLVTESTPEPTASTPVVTEEAEEKKEVSVEKEDDTAPVATESADAPLESKNEETAVEEKSDTQPLASTTNAETGILADNPTSDEVKEWLKDIRPDNTKETVKDGGNWGSKIMIALLVLLAMGLLGGGFYYFTNSMNGEGNQTANTNATGNTGLTPTPTEAPSVTPTSMPEAVDYSKLTLQILNGSGKPGEAGKAQALVADLKFKDTKTGNAPNFNFKETKVEMKSGVAASAFETLKEKLGKTYKVEASAETLPASSTYDVVITVGSTLAQ